MPPRAPTIAVVQVDDGLAQSQAAFAGEALFGVEEPMGSRHQRAGVALRRPSVHDDM
jgi:hypothetical protein